MSSLRDRDIRQDLADRLEATRSFDAAVLTGLPEDFGRGSRLLRLAIIQPDRGAASHDWDDSPDGGLIVDGRAKVIVIVRDDDPRTRDEAAEQLVDIVCNAANGQSLGGLTLPAFTLIDQWVWKDPEHPERRVELELVYKYLAGSWTDLGTDD